MVTTFTRTWQRPPTEEEAKGLVEDLVRNEIYYREAMAIGLDRDDGVIRRRMRQKMEFILEDISAQTEPTDEELVAYMKKHPDSYLLDPQIAFRHVYVNVDKRGKNAEADARQILGQLNQGTDPDSVGDPLLLDAEIRLSPLWDIRKQFGEEFGRNLLELKSGKWEGPVRSGFGFHLVLVTKRVGGRLPELKEVREIVKRDWTFDRQKEVKDGSLPRFAIHADCSAMALDDPLHHRQTHPGAFPHFFGGEVRIKYPLLDAVLHAITCVAHRQLQTGLPPEVRMESDQRSIGINLRQRDT